MKKYFLVFLFIFFCFPLSADNQVDLLSLQSDFSPTEDHDQTGFFFSILSGIQIAYGIAFPASMIQSIYDENLHIGSIKRSDEDYLLILNPEELVETVFILLDKSQYKCSIVTVSEVREIGSMAFTVRCGSMANGEIHYNLGDRLGNYVWDPVAQRDLIVEIHFIYIFDIYRD